ncbi:hypothetical protein DsansV1_C04g0039071 [Dioscorea sansibarensis]
MEDCSSSDSSMSNFMEDSTTTTSSPSSSSSSSSLHSLSCDKPEEEEEGPLFHMSSLMALLPLKRGLSNHFQGKSKSFTSLCNARSLEDLVKPERKRAYKKKIKACKSYEGSLDSSKSLTLSLSSITITKKPLRQR